MTPTAIINTVVSVAVLGAAGYGWYSYGSLKSDLKDQKDLVTKLTDKVEEQNTSLQAFQIQEKANEELMQSRQATAELLASTNIAVGELRKSIASLQRRSSNSLEACNKSYAVAGELLGTCGDRYKDVAGKAELLRQDAIALDKHSDLLSGMISDLRGLEPLNGND